MVIRIGTILLLAATFSFIGLQLWSDRHTAEHDSISDAALSKSGAVESTESEMADEITGKGPGDTASKRNKSSSAYDRKLKRRNQNAVAETGLSEDKLAAMHQQLRDRLLGEDNNQHLAGLHQQLTEEFGQEEADFRLAIIAEAGDWEAIKNLAEQRAHVLGNPNQYDQMLLDMGIGLGTISLSEIEHYLQGGATLPESTIYLLAVNGSMDTIAELSSRNLIPDPNFENPFLSMNAIGAFVVYAGNYPVEVDPESAADGVRTLIKIGVTPFSVDGAPDPLNEALSHVSNRNFAVRYALIEALLDAGLTVDDSHREQIASIEDAELAEEIKRLLENHM